MKVNFIGLRLKNPYIDSLLNKVRMEYLEYIDIPKCTELGLSKGVEDDPHITLIYNDSLIKGPNWYHWLLSIKNRDQFKILRDSKKLLIRSPKIDTFDNDDSRVLKFNFNDCNHIDVLTKLNEALESTASEKSKFTKYNPHLTITYLKSDTPDEIIDKLRSETIMGNYSEWDIDGVLISGEGSKFFPL